MRAVIADQLRPLAASIDNLALDPANARRGDIAAIRRSLTVFGQRKPVVVRRTGTDAHGRPTGIVMAGNHTLRAAQELGWDTVAALFIDDDATTAKAYAVADNRTGELATWDDDQLAATLRELGADDFDLTALGWNNDDLAALLGVPVGQPGLTDPDDAPDAPAAPVTAPGDLWLLGPHRVLCGDATDAGAVAAMLGGELADCLWTDPPYGVDYVGGSHQKTHAERRAAGGMSLRNDAAIDVPGLLGGAFAVAGASLRPGSPVYVCHPQGALAQQFFDAFVGAGWSHRQNLVWVKNSLVLSRSDYHYRHEPIIYGFTADGAGRLGRGGERWYGDDSQTSVFEVDRPARSELHPTMKPVALVAAMLANSCPHGGLVLDLFGGSGSTLIAADGLGMRAALVELDPAYVDVVCRRHQEHTGTLPVRATTGEPHDFGQTAPAAALTGP